MEQEIKQELKNMADEKYKEFHSSLCPKTDNILGVRVPVLRSYAKKLIKENGKEIIEQIGNDYYEEIMLQGMCIGLCNLTLEETKKYLKSWIPKIDNWAVCDVVCSGLKITKKYPKEMWSFIQKYVNSNKEFEIRFGVVMMLDFYINEEYVSKVLNSLDKIKHEGYYVKMAVAWAISIVYIKFPDITNKYLENNNLDEFTYRKAISKICDSYRVTKEDKERLKFKDRP